MIPIFMSAPFARTAANGIGCADRASVARTLADKTVISRFHVDPRLRSHARARVASIRQIMGGLRDRKYVRSKQNAAGSEYGWARHSFSQRRRAAVCR